MGKAGRYRICVNPLCAESLWSPTGHGLLCPSCWFMAKVGFAGGGALAAIVGFIVGWWRG